MDGDTVAFGAMSSAQLADLRRRNVSVIMQTVRRHGPVARAAITRLTGLGGASVSKLTAILIEAGALREESSAAAPSTQPGRPPVPLVLDDRHHRVIGVHFGLRRTVVGSVDLTGRMVDTTTLSHPDASFDDTVRQATDVVGHIASTGRGTAVLGVGASIGGWFDPVTGRVVEHAALGWKNAPLRTLLEQQLNLPVRLDSNVRAIALAESWSGHLRGVHSLLHVFVGNVVGAGLLIDGKLHRGPRSAAGYLDHLPVGARTDRRCRCGRYDCLQAAASDAAVVAQARDRGLLGASGELNDLVALARDGDRRAVTLLRTRARQVGGAVALLIEILNPDRVVIGGGVVDDPLFLPDLRAAAADRLHRPSGTDISDLVRATSFGRSAVALASAVLFLDAFYRDPLHFLASTSAPTSPKRGASSVSGARRGP